MRPFVDLYVQQFKTTLATMLQYRVALLIWTIGQVLEPLIYLIVWSAVSNGSGGSVGSYTTAEFAAYYVVLMMVNQISYTWIMYDFEYRVREGTLSATLLRPVHPIHSDIADNLSSKLITLPIIIVVATALAFGFRAPISPQPWAIAVFLLSLILAFLVRFLLEWSLALAAFWTTRVEAINQTYFVLMLFLSGQIAPLTLLPQPIQVVSYVFPFRWLISFPIEVFLGRLNLSQSLVGLAAQAVWLFLSFGIMRGMWRAGVRVYTAVGA